MDNQDNEGSATRDDEFRDEDPKQAADFAAGKNPFEPYAPDADRERGIFSPVDRRYLTGEKEYDRRQDKYERQKAIRQRVTDSIIDAYYLGFIDDDLREKIVSDLDGEDLWDAVDSVIQFVYESSEWDLELLERTIEGAIFSKSATTRVNVEIEVEHKPDVDALERKLNETGPGWLSTYEIGLLVEHGRLDPSDYDELVSGDPIMGDANPDDYK